MRALQRGIVEQHTIVRQDSDRAAPYMRIAADQRRAKSRLIFMEPAAIDKPRNDLAHIELRLDVARNNPVKLGRIVSRRFRLFPIQDGLVALGKR